MKRVTRNMGIALGTGSLVLGAAFFGNAASAATPETTYTKVYTTAYSYWDNTPPGSADISHPVIHNKAGGVGTFQDPITLAVGHVITNGKDKPDFAPGTKFYFPDVRKYAIVEDTCGDGKTPQNKPCHNLKTAPKNTQLWLDLWADGKDATRAQSDACLSKITDGNGVHHTAIKDPATDYVVQPLPVSTGATCRANYGNTPVKVTPTPTPTPTTPTPTPTPTPTGPPTCVPAKP